MSLQFYEVADLKFLLDHLKTFSADILDQHYRDGNTMLHLVVQHAEIEALELLLSYGANFELRNKDGYTPRELAVHLGAPEKEELLRSYKEISYVKGAVNK
jgi:ankyrin repeat protein